MFVNPINHISSKKAKAKRRRFAIEVLFSFTTKVHALALLSRLSQSALPRVKKNALFVNQPCWSNFALYMISLLICTCANLHEQWIPPVNVATTTNIVHQTTRPFLQAFLFLASVLVACIVLVIV